MKRRDFLKLLGIAPLAPSVLMAKEVVPFIDPQPYLSESGWWGWWPEVLPEDYESNWIVIGKDSGIVLC